MSIPAVPKWAWRLVIVANIWSCGALCAFRDFGTAALAAVTAAGVYLYLTFFAEDEA